MSFVRADLEDRSRVGRLLGAGVWLVFLGNPLGTIVDADRTWAKVLGLVALVVFAVVYMVGISNVRTVHVNGQYVRAWVFTLVLLACTAATVPGAGDQSTTCLVFVAALAVSLMHRWQGLVVAAVLCVGTTVAGQAVDGWSAHGNEFAILLATAAVWSFRLAWQRQARVMAAERDLSELAVEAERSRIARDLHDILGHSLTVISVKAELASRLIDVDPARARAEIEDMQRLSRDALADVRATTQGIRALSLPGEIAASRNALESAGVRPDLPTVADQVDSRWRELFAWTIREGVTNVIRHSGASRCTVTLDEARVTVADDGTGFLAHEDSGHGLDGLRQRARSAGATVLTGPGLEGRGFSLTVTVPDRTVRQSTPELVSEAE